MCTTRTTAFVFTFSEIHRHSFCDLRFYGHCNDFSLSQIVNGGLTTPGSFLIFLDVQCPDVSSFPRFWISSQVYSTSRLQEVLVNIYDGVSWMVRGLLAVWSCQVSFLWAFRTDRTVNQAACDAFLQLLYLIKAEDVCNLRCCSKVLTGSTQLRQQQTKYQLFLKQKLGQLHLATCCLIPTGNDSLPTHVNYSKSACILS